MATPVTALSPRTVQVYVDVDPKTKVVKNVTPDPFTIHKNQGQDVRWICIQGLPFTVDFNGQHGSPFHQSKFGHNQPWSGLAREDVKPDPDVKYKYTVTVDGGPPKDPDGVVDR